ncbi:MAG: hypothetical protein ACFFC7_12060 [Candidatus Hermodarchaeota archaeon]
MVNGDHAPSISCIQAFFDRWCDAKTAALEKLAKEAAEEISELFKFEEWRLLQEFIELKRIPLDRVKLDDVKIRQITLLVIEKLLE